MSPDEFKHALEVIGFKVYPNGLAMRENSAKWYACRKTQAADCECNDKPPQIVVTPHYLDFGTGQPIRDSATVDLCGELGGVWYKLQAYSLDPEQVISEIVGIERNLTAAWNSIASAMIAHTPEPL